MEKCTPEKSTFNFHEGENVLIKQCSVITWFQLVMVYSKSTNKVRTALCRLLLRRYSVDFEHVFAVWIVLKLVASGLIIF